VNDLNIPFTVLLYKLLLSLWKCFSFHVSDFGDFKNKVIEHRKVCFFFFFFLKELKSEQ